MSQETVAVAESVKATQANVVRLTAPKKISGPDFQLNISGQVYNSWVASAAVGVTEKDCLNQIYWTNVARQLHPMDEIRVWAKDGAWFGDFVVIFADDREARVQRVQWAGIDQNLTSDITGDSDYIAKWIAPPVKYGVIRKSDSEIVAKNFETMAHAQLWIAKRKQALS